MGRFLEFYVCWEGVAIRARGAVEGGLNLWDNWWLLLDRIQVFLKVYNLLLGAEIGEF